MLMMFPFEAPTIFEGVHKSHFRMPRVVCDQKGKFENDDLFQMLAKEGPVKYSLMPKKEPDNQRTQNVVDSQHLQMKFITGCQEGHTEVTFLTPGISFILTFNPTLNPAISGEGCDFDKEMNKVHIKSPFILNGVCVLWRGYIDLRTLEGSGCVEFDECRAYMEEHASKASIEAHTNPNSAANQLNQLTNLKQQPFNIMCNQQQQQTNQSNVAAAAALAAAAAANFHPGSPLGRTAAPGVYPPLPPPPQHTPPHSQHQNSNTHPALPAPPVSQHQQAPPSHNNHQHHSSSQHPQQATPINGNGLSGGPPGQQAASRPPVSSPQHQPHLNPFNASQLALHHPAAAAAAASVAGPLGQLNSCLSQAPLPPPPGSQMTPAHLAAAMGAMQNGDSYGNAAIAAAAAAAFHQALNANQQQHQQAMAAAAMQHSGGLAAMNMGLGPNGPGADFLAEMSHRQRAS